MYFIHFAEDLAFVHSNRVLAKKPYRNYLGLLIKLCKIIY